MITETEGNFWKWLTDWVETLASNLKGLMPLCWLFYTLVSWGIRYTSAELNAQGITEWALTGFFRHELLRLLAVAPRNIIFDALNGYFGMLFLTSSPIWAFWFFRLVYPLVLWAGLAWPVHLLHIRLTPWPNVDLLLWPALAIAVQVFAVSRALRAMEEARFVGAAYRIRNGHLAIAFAGLCYVVGIQLFVIAGYFSSAWTQVFLRWLFTR